jgi:hypothetical protein
MLNNAYSVATAKQGLSAENLLMHSIKLKSMSVEGDLNASGATHHQK